MVEVGLDRATGVVDFENINVIKKKSVRGLLRKRAKKYESESDASSDPENKGETGGVGDKRKQKVVRKTMASAFKLIMRKTIPNDEEPV